MYFKKILYIRDDDVAEFTSVFADLFKFFKNHKIPINYGVIPQLIENKLVDFLNREKQMNPQLFDITQHGFSHKNYNTDMENKYEFGPVRTFFLQKQDITKGYKKMKQFFGKNFTPVFIPPYHGYDENTLKVIKKLGMPIFSAGEKTKMEKKPFLDFPAQISLNDYDNQGAPLSVNAKELIKKVAASLKSPVNPQGMVFHHSAVNSTAKLKQLKLFFLFLNKLNQEKQIKIVCFHSFLK